MRGALSGLLAALLVLSGCVAPDVMSVPAPEPRPVQRTPEPERRTAESLDLETYFVRVEESLKTRGFLRSEGGGLDAPWDAAMLEAGFLKAALFQEYSVIDGQLVLRESPVRLRRWSGPVLIEPRFDALIPADRRAADLARIDTLARRLARVTGHDVRVVPDGGNFPVLILYDAARKRVGPALRDAIPGMGGAPVRAIENLPRATYCTLIVSDAANDGRITHAVSVIRAELPDDLRLSCIHEEIAQGLGLTNDSDETRPSIFSDDDEWGRLTELDEALLKMLYDPSLRPGMRAEEAAPFVRPLAERLAPVPSS